MFDTISPESRTGRVLPLGILAAAGFLSTAGARVVDPLLAVIAQDFKTSVPAVAVVVAAFTLSYGFCQLVLGPIGDSFGKLRVMRGALLGYALFTGCCGLAPSLAGLTLLRACAGAASAGLIPICLAYIGDSVPYDLRQVTVSRFLVGTMLAQTIAGPIGGAFGEYVGWRGVFFVLAASALALAGVLSRQIAILPDRVGASVFHPENYRTMWQTPVARRLLLTTLVEGALVSAFLPFLAPFLHEIYGLSFGAAGLVLACFGLGSLAFGQIAPQLVKVFGEDGLVLVGGATMAAGVAAAAVSRSWLIFIPVELALGLGYFMLHTVLQARATELLPHARSTAVSSFVFMLFVGQSIGAVASGVAIAWVGYRAAFMVIAALLLMLGMWLWRFIRVSA